MKRLLPYGLFTAVMVLCLAAASMDYGGAYEVHKALLHDISESSQQPDGEAARQCFTVAAVIPGGAAGRIQTSRVPVSVLKSTGGDTFSKLKIFFSRRTNRRFQIVTTTYHSYYSRKEKDGYYIYALRKLLI